MVGPSISDDQRRGLNRRIKVGFVAMVAMSGGLTGVWAGGSTTVVVGGAVGGALLGTVLIWYLSWLSREAREKARGRTPEMSWSPGEDREESEEETDRREARRGRP